MRPGVALNNSSSGAELMAAIDPESSASDRTDPASEGDAPQPSRIDAPPPPVGMGRLLVFASVAGLVAGAAALVAGEIIMERYRGDLFQNITTHPRPEDMQRWRDARVYSAVLTFTALGGFLGLTMGLAGGLARRSAFAGASAATAGLLLGAAAAAALSRVLVAYFFRTHDPQSNELLLPLLTHGAIWATVGAVAGLVFGLGLGGKGVWRATLAGGLAGAAAATIIYEIVGALAFASAKTDLPVSSSPASRGMAHLLIAILSAAGAAWALRQYPRKKPVPSVLS
jgi:hypothetical protein